MNRWFGGIGVAAVCLLNVACGGDRTMRVSKVYVVAPAGDAPAVMYLTIENATDGVDTLVGVTTSAARRAELHAELHQESGGAMAGMAGMSHAQHMAMMTAVAAIPVAAHSTVRLAPGGYHVMLMQPAGVQRDGSVPVTLRFTRAGEIQTTARVIGYADVDSAVGRAQ